MAKGVIAVAALEAAQLHRSELGISHRLGHGPPALKQGAPTVEASPGSSRYFHIEFCQTSGDNCHGTSFSFLLVVHWIVENLVLFVFSLKPTAYETVTDASQITGKMKSRSGEYFSLIVKPGTNAKQLDLYEGPVPQLSQG